MKVHARRQPSSSRVNIYISTHLFLPDHSKTITNDVTLTLHYLTLPYISIRDFIFTHMRTRLYNAAASPSLLGWLVGNKSKILHIIQLLHYKAGKYFINISWWTAATLFQKIFNSTTSFLKYFDYS